MLKQHRNALLLFLAIAIVSPIAASSQKISSLVGSIEKNNGSLRLNLSNNSSEEFKGFAIIGIGSDSEQKDIGKVSLTLPANETGLFKLSATPAGGYYKLAIYQAINQRERLVFLKIAPIRNVSDSSAEIPATLLPVKSSATVNPQTSKPSQNVEVAEINEPIPLGPEVQVKTQLLAGTGENDPFILSFDFTSHRPVYDATLQLVVGKFKETRPVSINRQSNVQIKLPDQLDSELFIFTLTSKDGRSLARDEIELSRLMSEDFVNVADIRTDRQSYGPGDSVRLTVMLEGKSKNGYRIEISVKNGRGNIIHQDQKQSGGDDHQTTQEFSFTIPRDASGPIILEFKIYDAETGLLFDSGEREIPVDKK